MRFEEQPPALGFNQLNWLGSCRRERLFFEAKTPGVRKRNQSNERDTKKSGGDNLEDRRRACLPSEQQQLLDLEVLWNSTVRVEVVD
jgi:hypothetical protein